MSETASPFDRHDSAGRRLLHEARSPDGQWHVEIWGANKPRSAGYGVARLAPHQGYWGFPIGDEIESKLIEVRWELPNESWGVFIDHECWAICSHRPVQRMAKVRVLSRSGFHSKPFTTEEIRFAYAKRRGQRAGTKGHIIEE